MFELSGVNYEEVLEQGDSILVRVIASWSYRGFELSGLFCIIGAYLASLFRYIHGLLIEYGLICHIVKLRISMIRPFSLVNISHINYDGSNFQDIG